MLPVLPCLDVYQVDLVKSLLTLLMHIFALLLGLNDNDVWQQPIVRNSSRLDAYICILYLFTITSPLVYVKCVANQAFTLISSQSIQASLFTSSLLSSLTFIHIWLYRETKKSNFIHLPGRWMQVEVISY